MRPFIANAKIEDKILSDYAHKVTHNNTIDSSLFTKYNVKRGLRNADGTGVLVGLTTVGEVHGYVFDENEKRAVEGRLRYHGIEIEDLVEGFQKEKRFGFHETAYLLLFGELPTLSELQAFDDLLDSQRDLPEGFTENMILKAPSPDVMNKLARAVLASYSYDENPDDISLTNMLRQCIELIARFPTMAAYGYQAKRHYYDNNSLYIHRPATGKNTAGNFLQMIRPDMSYTPLEAELLDLALVLHAEHGGGNNSTFAVHVVSSSDTDTYSAIASALGSLKGPKHGGANVKVVQMMNDMKSNLSDYSNEKAIEDYLAGLVRKEQFDKKGLIYGMGHAVYTVSDPRAIILREKAMELAKEKGRTEEFEFYKLVEKCAHHILCDMKSGKQIATNVDFYSGLVYDMLNIPPELYTPIFAISRMAGWAAHRIEENVSGGRIIRPAYKSVSGVLPYIPGHER